MRTSTVSAAVLAALLLSSIVQPAPAIAQLAIEEITVTARQREETLQDVPVTVAAFTEEDLQRYAITTLTEAAKPGAELPHTPRWFRQRIQPVPARRWFELHQRGL